MTTCIVIIDHMDIILAKKCPLGKLISELYGRVGGANSGLAGSQDISYKENNFLVEQFWQAQ